MNHNIFTLKGLSGFDSSKGRHKGVTLIEMLIVFAIIGILAAIIIPVYAGYMEQARVYNAIEHISSMSVEISDYGIENGSYPASLEEFGYGDLIDPWGNPYQYLNLAGANKGMARKDKALVPINSDFDLYSMGKDGETSAALTVKTSKDDIIRANDGQYIGIAEAY